MYLTLLLCLLTITKSWNLNMKSYENSIFQKSQVIFVSDFNITKILVPCDGSQYLNTDTSEIPSIFFTVSDPKLEGGSCIYVLEGFAAYEILEGGRDSTSDYGSEKAVFFGAKDGIYKYNPETLSAKKFGPFNDDIIQIQKANGTDLIYILTSDQKIYRIENQGSNRTRVNSVMCAKEFVLDTSNNLYFIDCDDGLPHIVRYDESVVSFSASFFGESKSFQLFRPAFIMDDCVPFLADGSVYMLYANGSSESKDFHVKERPSAVSIDASLYIVAALDGKIYEFSVMEMILKSMFGVSSDFPNEVTRVLMSMFDTVKHEVFGDWNQIVNHNYQT